MRLNRYLSLCGQGSRRGCEQLIAEGAVSINGSYIKTLGTQVKEGDEVKVHGKLVRLAKGIVLALNKPKGYVCSRGDTHKRLTIYDLLPSKYQTLHHVGRLDKESEGLLLMTNRGDLSHRLLHPSQGVEKEYEVIVDRPLEPGVFPKLIKGMMTPEGYAKAERAWLGNSEYRLHLVLKQGLKRQIRHMMFGLGFEVERLVRVRLGWLQLKGLAKGSWKELTEAEVERFFSDFEAPKVGATRKIKPKLKQETEPRKRKPTAAAKTADFRDKRPAAKRAPASRKPVAGTRSDEAGKPGRAAAKSAPRRPSGGGRKSAPRR